MAANHDLDLARLKELMAEASDLDHALSVLSWDQLVMMPEGGAVARGASMETLAKIYHNKFTADEVGHLTERLAPYAESLPEDDDDRCLIEQTRRDWERERRIPEELAGELAGFEATHVPIWLEARKKQDFRVFQPSLQKAGRSPDARHRVLRPDGDAVRHPPGESPHRHDDPRDQDSLRQRACWHPPAH